MLLRPINRRFSGGGPSLPVVSSRPSSQPVRGQAGAMLSGREATEPYNGWANGSTDREPDRQADEPVWQHDEEAIHKVGLRMPPWTGALVVVMTTRQRARTISQLSVMSGVWSTYGQYKCDRTRATYSKISLRRPLCIGQNCRLPQWVDTYHLGPMVSFVPTLVYHDITSPALPPPARHCRVLNNN